MIKWFKSIFSGNKVNNPENETKKTDVIIQTEEYLDDYGKNFPSK